MRSAAGSYLRSRRSISRKPVILPINPDAPASYLRHSRSFRDAPQAQTRNLDVASRDSGFVLRTPRNDANSTPPSSPRNGFAVIAGGARSCAPRRMSHKHLCLSSFEARRRRLAPQDDAFHYAPIAIFGSASALAFISFSARRYSTGITLRNFGSDVFQFARISAARFEPVNLAWREIKMCSRSTSESSRFWNTSTRPCASRSLEW